ncbi:unnamed protein product [Ostreobium quekettii]|uniref:Uncharacterized protein n=1 Tax=Ostreobium quekettii TaxID=121088 RepID=A0A8S1IWL8_9CHLO|nr:unnamed protein product [Ostreobium quekettii]|eukprot:evm.model.scf_2106.3 EVM.evm.TU.scf_2106.3   scf_2106:23013-23735(-)
MMRSDKQCDVGPHGAPFSPPAPTRAPRQPSPGPWVARLLGMKLTAIGVLRWNGDAKEPNVLGFACDLSNFGYFQRGSVRDFITFTSRTIVQRTQRGQRQTVQHEDYFIHVHVKESGLAGVAVCDQEYPQRAAFSVVTRALEDYGAKFGDAFRSASGDGQEATPVLEQCLARFQDPAQADKLTKIQRDLDETKVILHKTIESVLERGEKLDHLVEKSSDLSLASQMFYKTAKRSNSCCKMM